MRIAFVGCGFVADYYIKTLPNHPNLELVGVTDKDEERRNNFASFHQVKAYDDLDTLLDDSSIDIIVNLTNPGSHYGVSLASLKNRQACLFGKAASHNH